MTGFTALAPSPNSVLGVSSGSCRCKPELTQRSAKTSPLYPRIVNKKGSKKTKNDKIKINAFKGREAKLNQAIFYVLSSESPLAVWDILGRVKILPGFKRAKYSVINERVKALETQSYLRKTGTRKRKQGGETNIFTLTTRARLAMALCDRTMDDIISQLDDHTSTLILRAISEQASTQI